MRLRLTGAVLLLLSVSGACSTDRKADAAQPTKPKEGSVPPRPTVVSQPKEAYRPISVTGGARLTGTIDFDGVIPADSVIVLSDGQTGCGRSINDHRVEHTGSRIGGAVVWLSDIRSGKPLPIERRFELANGDCLLTPRVQAVLAPGTLNIASTDVAFHRDRIINVGTGELEGVAPFNDNGEVIPFDKLLDGTKQLEITCDIHPWARAWILVFDHPYFATTEKSGTFTIADIPPGTYHVKAWHPLLGVADQVVTVAAGQSASIALKLGSGAMLPVVAPTSAQSGKPESVNRTRNRI
jgi:hypothetical protein